MDDVIVTQNARVDDLLVELSLLDSEDRELNIALMSDNEEFKKLNYFIFSSVENINYYTIDTPYDQDLSILSQMDLIIYNKYDKDLEDTILENIEKKHINCKFLYVADDRRHRKVDLLEEYLVGVSKVIKIDSELEDFIFEVQRELGVDFYSKRLKRLEPQGVLYDVEDFENRVNELIEKRVCFTKLRYHYDSDLDISEYNLKKILREKDTIYIDKKRQEMYFLLLDVFPTIANTIIKSRLKNFSIRVSEISHKSVFDIVFEG